MPTARPRRTAALLALAAASALLCASPAAARSYRYVDLGLITPFAVNARNVAAASEIVLSPDGRRLITRALRVSSTGERTQLAELPTGENWGAFPFDIALDGSVVGLGVSEPAPFTAFDPPVIWPGDSTAPRPLSTTIEGTARAIAPTANTVVGWHWFFDGTANVRVAFTSTRSGPLADAPGLMLLDVNDAGDRILTTGTAPYTFLVRNGATLPLGLFVQSADGAGQHPLGEDGGVAGQVPVTGKAALRKPDGTIVELGVDMVPVATQGGAVVGSQTVQSVAKAVLWKAGRLVTLADLAPGAPALNVPTDIATNGTIVGYSQVQSDPLNRVRGWMLLYQARITGQVVEPPAAAAPTRAAAATAGRPRAGIRVVITPDGGAPITRTTDAQGRFTADVPAGRVRIALPGRSACLATTCAATTTLTLDDDRALTLRIDPAAKPARAALPAAAIKARRGAIPVAIRCRLVTAPCRGTARIARRGTVLASVRLSIPAGGSATRRLALTRAGRTALAGGATIKATLALAIRTGSRTTTATQPIRIHS